MRVLWEEHLLEEYWGVLLIYARNPFNEKNWIAMLLAVWHEWPSGAQFTFNCYHNRATLVLRYKGGGSGHFLQRKEGVTQGLPLAKITYGIRVLPLIRELQGDHPRGTQPWYADDAGAGGGVQTHPSASSVLTGTGPAKGLLSGSDHKNFGRGPTECSPGGGFLLGDGN